MNEWNLITQLNRPRRGVQLVGYDNRYLFAIGGNNGMTIQISLERYDSKTKIWAIMSDMTIPRSQFASAVLED